MPKDQPFQRLPSNIKPINYTVVLTPDLNKFTFDGDVSIKIEVIDPTEKIILNASKLDLKLVELITPTKETISPTNFELSETDETVSITFPSDLVRHTFELHIVYVGTLNDQLRGFYRSKVVTEEGECYVAATQFEATDARLCLPCWDEPALKATFDCTLIAPKQYIALSNMPIKKETVLDEGIIKTEFDTTPIMSTYLLAFFVGEYDHIEQTLKDGISYTVYTPKGRKEQSQFALEVAYKTVYFFGKYFGIKYPLPKMDLLALQDFNAGAMENWGLITFRETLILVDPENTSLLRKQTIAQVVGHEIAHQWFGNLVTMEWWTHLWLNEGYATFCQFLCVDDIFPEYEIWNQFISEHYNTALGLDSMLSSHAIEVEVGSEISAIFDTISYKKGSSIIRMLHSYIGDCAFRDGMHLYLNRFQYKNAITADLWSCLEEASRKPIVKLMTNWTKLMGYPLIIVTIESRKSCSVVLKLEQKRFVLHAPKKYCDYEWLVPIMIITSSSPSEPIITTVLNSTEGSVNIPYVSQYGWIKLNPDCTGFYRTLYPPEMMTTFIPAILDHTLPSMDRLQLINDLQALVRAGYRDTVILLKFLAAYENETNSNVWSTIAEILSKLEALVVKHCYEDLLKFERKLVRKAFDLVGWEQDKNESLDRILLRGVIFNKMSTTGDIEFVKLAKSKLDQHLEGGHQITVDIIGSIFKVVALHYPEMYEPFMKRFIDTKLQEEKLWYMKAMCSFKEPELVRKTFEFCLSDKVRSQDVVYFFVNLGDNLYAIEPAWNYLKENIAKILEKVSPFKLGYLIDAIAAKSTTEEMLRDFEQFFDAPSIPVVGRTFTQAKDTINSNIEWAKRDLEAIKEFLKATSANQCSEISGC